MICLIWFVQTALMINVAFRYFLPVTACSNIKKIMY
mgnify:CR=1 FL=1